MGDVPTTVNKTVHTVTSIINIAIMDVAVNAAYASAVSSQPWLGFPIISTIFRWALKKAFGFVDQFIEQTTAFAIIDGQTNAEAANYLASVAALKQAAAVGDQSAIDKATADFKANLARLIHYDGS